MSTSDRAEQLTLDVHLNDEATFDNFVMGSDPVRQTLLNLFASQPNSHTNHNDDTDSDTDAAANLNNETCIYLSGTVGSGRSHLLQAVCHMASQQQLPCLYLPLASFTANATANIAADEIMTQLEFCRYVCLDDIDQVLHLPGWEEALFHLYNRIKQQGNTLVVSAGCPPAQLQCQLADLRSRLGWGLVFHLNSYNDADKQAILQHRATIRGLKLSSEAALYLLQHYQRNLHGLMQALDKLDKNSLKDKRALTIPFIKQVLNC